MRIWGRRHMGALASYVKDRQAWARANVQVFVTTVKEHYWSLRLVVCPVLVHLPSCCWWLLHPRLWGSKQTPHRAVCSSEEAGSFVNHGRQSCGVAFGYTPHTTKLQNHSSLVLFPGGKLRHENQTRLPTEAHFSPHGKSILFLKRACYHLPQDTAHLPHGSWKVNQHD